MVEYQAQLDRVKSIGAKPDANPVLGVQSSWDRTDLMQLARREIDTMVDLNRLLQSTKEPILDLAPTPRKRPRCVSAPTSRRRSSTRSM